MLNGPSGVNGTGASLTNDYPNTLTNDEVIRQFLEHTVENYLIGDLKTIVEPMTLQGPNELGYPAVLLIMIGAELLGNLIDMGKSGGKAADEFWIYMKQIDPKYDIPGVADSLYGLARNGIAHFYTPNTKIIISRRFGENFCKKRFNGEVRFHINCYELFNDFEKAYKLAKGHLLSDSTMYLIRANNIREHVKWGQNKLGGLVEDVGEIEDYTHHIGYISA